MLANARIVLSPLQVVMYAGINGRNYAEARKAFQLASMYDPTNLQVTIDLASLHVQMSDYKGYRSCHQKLIAQLPNRSNFWLGFMVGTYLEGNYTQCVDVIRTYRDTLEKKASVLRQELVFLEADSFVAKNDLPSAIVCLRSGMNDILDEDTANERLATLYGQTGE